MPLQVRVHTDTGVFEADAAIVTVPLGVLKRAPHEAHAVRFQPPLPQRKLTAIKRLGFGCLNKVMLLFPYSFWGDRVGGTAGRGSSYGPSDVSTKLRSC